MNFMRVFLASLMLASCFALPADAAQTVLEAQGVSRPMYNAQLSFAVPGSVYEIAVKTGQTVKEGDLLLHLDSRAEDKRIAQIQNEIESNIKIRTLQTRIEQARLDMKRYGDALRENAATLMEYQHAKLAYDLSVLALEEEEFRIAQLKHSLEELAALRDRMYLYAPCDGYVEEILVEKGMAVDRNVLALRLVAIDPILVELALPVDQAMQLQVNDAVEVRQPGSENILAGEVAHIAKIAVLSNRTLKVRVHVSNPQGMPVGLMVTVRFPNIAVSGKLDPIHTGTIQGESHESRQ